MVSSLTYTPTKGRLRGVFTEDEIEFSRYHGELRTNVSREMNLNPLKSGKRKYDHCKQLEEDFRGVLGELAVAKYFGLTDWIPTLNKFKDPDVLTFQVRSSYYFKMRVPIRKKDILTYRYIGVHVDLNTMSYNILGWVEGIWANDIIDSKPDKDDDWAEDSFVKMIPYERYRPMSEIFNEEKSPEEIKLEDYVNFELFKEWL